MKGYTLQTSPFIVPTFDGKIIKEHFGLATDNNNAVSIAQMTAPPGWSEPFQIPEFEEFTLIISGKKQITVANEKIILKAGQSIKIEANIRVQYANPFDEPCQYISVCIPAFSIDKANRETF